MRVAVAVDGSTSSLHAVRALIDVLGSRKDVEVHVVNVQPPVHWFDLLSDEKQKIVQQWQQEAGEDITRSAMRMLAGADLAHVSHVVIGEPAEAIVRCTSRLGCDMILMGTRGMGGVAGLVLGSVATKVVHLSEVPVMLVK